MRKNIILCGVGGQGIVLTSKLLAASAMAKGIPVMSAETIGMAQKGGSVFSFLRMGDDLCCPMFPKGTADLLIGFEPAEAVRMLPYLKPDGTVILNTHPIQPVTATLGGGTALFFHGSGTGRVSGLLLDGQRPGLSAVPLYPGMRHRAAAAPDLFGSGQAFPAAVPAAVPRCCADLHPVEPEIWTFRQTFSKSIFFFAFTLAER